MPASSLSYRFPGNMVSTCAMVNIIKLEDLTIKTGEELGNHPQHQDSMMNKYGFETTMTGILWVYKWEYHWISYQHVFGFGYFHHEMSCIKIIAASYHHIWWQSPIILKYRHSCNEISVEM